MKTNVHQKPLTPDASLLKQINFTRILSLLRYYPRLTRAHMAPQTGLTRSTVTVITIELIATGLVHKGRETTSGPDGGRPGVELELNRDGAFFIGAAIGDGGSNWWRSLGLPISISDARSAVAIGSIHPINRHLDGDRSPTVRIR